LRINQREYHIRGLHYIVRSAREEDAKTLSDVRLQIDGETENLDREKGEAYIDEKGFKKIIKDDTESINNLFLVAEVNGKVVGFSRCEGSKLKRTSHRVEFGVGVLKEYWGYGIGKNFLKESVNWADSNGIRKITLRVLETNEKAIKLYKEYGFEVEGILKEDKLLSDGNYYNTLLMGRFKQRL
jgi:RimJ/RimL family protein N-acetyltransferase